MRTRYSFELKIFELPFKEPKSLQEVEANKQPKQLQGPDFPTHRIKVNQMDQGLKQAKEYIRKKQRQIRSISVSDQGYITAVVYTHADSKMSNLTVRESDLKK